MRIVRDDARRHPPSIKIATTNQTSLRTVSNTGVRRMGCRGAGQCAHDCVGLGCKIKEEAIFNIGRSETFRERTYEGKDYRIAGRI